ncbi:hypothetical protein [Stomatohabitans albus]|uniref:hypothetical protein n=1 Tax=Stomatohabitans albus TaxID=3110766 RepID=UPI00300C0A0C
MSTPQPPHRTNGPSLPPGYDPTAFDPFGHQAETTPQPPRTDDHQRRSDQQEPLTELPSYDEEHLATDDPTAWAWEPSPQPQQEETTPPFTPGGYTQMGVGHEPRIGNPEPRSETAREGVSKILIGLVSSLLLIVIAGGGYWFYLNDQAVKAEQQAKLEEAEREKARIESENIALESEKQAAAEAAKQREEALEQQLAQASQPATQPIPPVTPTPVEPAAPAQPNGSHWKPPQARPPQRSSGLLGSGCTPQTDHLPNGTWFGFASDEGNDTMRFDLVCLYADGRIRNDNSKLRVLNANGFQYPEGSFVGIVVSDGVITNLWLEGP